MTANTPWLCPHCDIPLRILEIQPGERIVPCPECHQPIQIVTVGRHIKEIRACEPPAANSPASRRSIISESWLISRARVSNAWNWVVTRPRTIGLSISVTLGIAVVGVWIAYTDWSDGDLVAPDGTRSIDDVSDDQTAHEEQVSVVERASLPKTPENQQTASPVTKQKQEESSNDKSTKVTLDPPPLPDQIGKASHPSAAALATRIQAITDQLATINHQYQLVKEHAAEGTPTGPRVTSNQSSSPLSSSESKTSTARSPKPDDLAKSTIDVEKSLLLRVDRWEQPRAVPLEELLQQFEELVGSRLVIADADRSEIESRLKQPVTFLHRQKSLADILVELLQAADLRYEVRNNAIHVLPAVNEGTDNNN